MAMEYAENYNEKPGGATASATAADDVVVEIATAPNVRSRRWTNSAITFAAFKQRLKTPIRTRETVLEYAAMDKTERNRAKDVGGFVGGATLDGERKNESIATRTLLTADLDHATPEFLAAPENVISFAAALYSTHSHTPAAPRVRLVAPLSRAVAPREYEIIAQLIARNIGANMFDPCSFRPAQMMFWPSCPADGEYYYREIAAPIFDVDAFLTRAGGAQTPLTAASGQARATSPGVTPQDPRGKDGVIGAFCRAYTVSAGIAAFLADCYEYAGADGPGRARYTWRRGEGARGLIVYDDLFAYSYHGTDPANDGHAQNIFDLVCIHRFSGNVKSAIRALAADPAVAREIGGAKDFCPAADERNAWRLALDRDDAGRCKNTVTNCVDILTNDPRFAGFAINTLAAAVEVTGDLPWARSGWGRFWREADRAQLIGALDRMYAHFSGKTVDIAFLIVAYNRQFNPLAAWFDSLPPWDGAPRVDTLLSRYLGADQNDYTAAVIRKTLFAAVARAYTPAIKFDYVPVLDGAQGIGKSTFWRILAGDDYFTNALTIADMAGKAAAEKIQGYWIAEIAELAGLGKTDIAKMRSFITQQNDDYRAAYGHVSERHPRVTILVGTVNGERGYLRDPDGDRRFWPVVCRGTAGGAAAIWRGLEKERDQIFAEILEMYNGLRDDKNAMAAALQMDTPGLRAAALQAQTAAIESDDRESLIAAYLDTPILPPESWNRLSIDDRVHFVRGEIGALSPAARDLAAGQRVRRDRVCLLEIYIECLGGTVTRYDKREQRTLAQAMKRLAGWEKSAQRGDFGAYGSRAVEYVRDQ